MGSCTPQSRALLGGHCGGGLHLLDQAPALGGFAQEPPVVVGVAHGSILLHLLLLRVLHRPAPAGETQGPSVSGDSARGRAQRIPAHPALGRSSSPFPPLSAGISERTFKRLRPWSNECAIIFLSRFSKLL